MWMAPTPCPSLVFQPEAGVFHRLAHVGTPGQLYGLDQRRAVPDQSGDVAMTPFRVEARPAACKPAGGLRVIWQSSRRSREHESEDGTRISD